MKLEKITENEKRRWYDDACGAALALELVGERWSLLIVRELMFGPRRFLELRAGLSGISANVLTQRLEGLEMAGIIQRRKLPPPASVQVYELTAWGYETEPIFQALWRWAMRSPRHDPTLPLSPASLMLSLRMMIDQTRASALTGSIGFRFGAEEFVGRLDGGTLDVKREDAKDADVIFNSDPTTMIFLVYGKRPFMEAEASGRLILEGDRALGETFATLFSLPPKIAR